MNPDLSPLASPDESRAYGKALRSAIPRRDQALLDVGDRDPVAILESQHRYRVPGLIPVRIGRMLESPFAYYRGTAAVMAHDLAGMARTGRHVGICGDAHISNFGFYASPERRILFDLNDFDEVSVGPWEWDVKRLVASVVLAWRDAGLRADQTADAANAAARSYHQAIAKVSGLPALDRYYEHVESDTLAERTDRDVRKTVDRTVRKAAKRTSARLLDRVTAIDASGSRRIVEQPPLMVHVQFTDMDAVLGLWRDYLATLRPDRALLLSQYRFVDSVLRVVGVGSVGTRCYVVLLKDPSGAPLFLQVKEAQPSVIQTYGRIPWTQPAGIPPVDTDAQGYRVVSGQRILQAQSDPFLGWLQGWPAGDPTRTRVDYYVRQFRDMKGSFELDTLDADELSDYGRLCGVLLARAHAQSPNPAAIVGYLGSSDVFDDAVTSWPLAYADRVEREFAALEAAVAAGRLPAERDV